MWWMAAAWAGWSASVSVEDHGGPPIAWTVDDASAHPPVTWTGPDGAQRRALVTALYGAGPGQGVVEVHVQTRQGRRWVDETKPMFLTTADEEAVMAVGVVDGPFWVVRARLEWTEAPEVVWLSAWVPPREAPAPRSLAVPPGLTCDGLDVAEEGPTTRVTFPAATDRLGAVQRWACDRGGAPVEVRLVAW